MVLPFLFPATLILELRTLKEVKSPAGGGGPLPDSNPFNAAEFPKNLACLSSKLARTGCRLHSNPSPGDVAKVVS